MTRGVVKRPDGTTQDMGELKLEIDCPCGQPVTVYEAGILHKEPRCLFFEQYEPVDYLRWIRLRKSRAN